MTSGPKRTTWNTLRAYLHVGRRVDDNGAVVSVHDDKVGDESRALRPEAHGAHDENNAVEAMADNSSADVGECRRARCGYAQARDRAAGQLGKRGAGARSESGLFCQAWF